MIRDEDGALTGYVYLNLNTNDYGGFVNRAEKLLNQKVALPAGYTWRWAGEYEFEMRAKQAPHDHPAHCLFRDLPTALSGLQIRYRGGGADLSHALRHVRRTAACSGLLGYNFSVAVWVGYIALFGIAVETGVVMVVYLHEAFQHRLAQEAPMTEAGLEQAVIEGAVQRLRPKLMTVAAVILSLAPILWETGIGSDVMKPIAAPIVGGMITSTIHVLILVPVFFLLIKRRALRQSMNTAQLDKRCG